MLSITVTNMQEHLWDSFSREEKIAKIKVVTVVVGLDGGGGGKTISGGEVWGLDLHLL